jgi:hypothetical protein
MASLSIVHDGGESREALEAEEAEMRGDNVEVSAM